MNGWRVRGLVYIVMVLACAVYGTTLESAQKTDSIGDEKPMTPRPGLYGANDGALLPAPQQPRQPPPVQARQRPLHAGNDRGPR